MVVQKTFDSDIVDGVVENEILKQAFADYLYYCCYYYCCHYYDY